jgi:hypothetical protein
MTIPDQMNCGSTVAIWDPVATIVGVGARDSAYLPPSKGGHAGQYAGRGPW